MNEKEYDFDIAEQGAVMELFPWNNEGKISLDNIIASDMLDIALLSHS